jgi:hypothetical protein|tara:strand:- start:151 stop:318 length:168 start_codon:yes stop_codon:yes gene_type:complete
MVGVTLGVAVTDGVTLGVAVTDGVTLGVIDGVTDSEGDGVGSTIKFSDLPITNPA